MDANEVVLGEVQADRVDVVFDLFRKGVRRAREPAQIHPHREVLAFRICGGNLIHVGVAGAPSLFKARQRRTAIARHPGPPSRPRRVFTWDR